MKGKLQEALGQFESIISRDSTSFQAIKYAGIVSLMMKQYDKALNYFLVLGSDTQLYSNPGKFYAALTLLKRNQPGDKLQGKKLLEEVIRMDGDEKEKAIQLLNKW